MPVNDNVKSGGEAYVVVLMMQSVVVQVGYVRNDSVDRDAS